MSKELPNSIPGYSSDMAHTFHRNIADRLTPHSAVVVGSRPMVVSEGKDEEEEEEEEAVSGNPYLRFQKGDTLEIINTSEDPNCYEIRRSDGLEGTIKICSVHMPEKRHVEKRPYSPTATSMARVVSQPRTAATLKCMPWFHGSISRTKAEELLSITKNGKFLVRESQSYKGDFTLCVTHDGEVEHYHVHKDQRDWFTVDDEKYFENLVKLIEHYKKPIALGLCCQLEYPVDKTGGNTKYAISTEDFIERGWAIPKEHLTKKHQIGKGEFGGLLLMVTLQHSYDEQHNSLVSPGSHRNVREVWLGEYKGSKVAIKMLKDPKVSQQVLIEASTMTILQHPNLVCLIGVSLDSPPFYLITEFMSKGSLVNYLRTRGRSVISNKDQLDYAKDACRGMVYLESQNFVHRDLAARNVLISDCNRAKVSDFGLTCEGLPRISKGTKISIKWTAPEALREKKFSNKSDVWSFGILLWEIYSYGHVPYPRVATEEVTSHVNGGYRMNAPDGCPDEIYCIMKECWHKDPSQRPNFACILISLDSISAAS